MPLLPALFYDVGDRTAQIRADFERTVAERLDEAYYEPLSRWCAEHGIALTGHPAGSDEIGPLRLFQLPGQDLVWRCVVPDGRTALEGATARRPSARRAWRGTIGEGAMPTRSTAPTAGT